MVVKFADTQKEKDQKRIHQATTNLWGIGSMGLNTLTPQYLTVCLFDWYAAVRQPDSMGLGLERAGSRVAEPIGYTAIVRVVW